MKKNYSLIGVDGNAFCVMGYVSKAMKECKKTEEEIDEYLQEAKSSDYNNLLCVSMYMIEKLNKGE